MNIQVAAITVLGAIVVSLLIRLTGCLPQYRRRKNLRKKRPLRTLVFFGSGGHTTEMLRMIRNLNEDNYAPVSFVMAHSDQTSEGKVRAANIPFVEKASWHRINRSREVKQSWISTLLTTAVSCVHALVLVFQLQPQVIICNGPGE
jgi:beta-1,4-N-acetylglucosaminyltransferase